MVDYSKKVLQELYQDIPRDLQKAISSQKVGEKIYKACVENRLTDDKKITQVIKYAGYVLLGLILPGKLSETLEKEVKINKLTALKIARQIKESVFMEVKKSLEALYQIEIKSEKPKKKKSSPKKPKKKDKYREII